MKNIFLISILFFSAAGCSMKPGVYTESLSSPSAPAPSPSAADTPAGRVSVIAPDTSDKPAKEISPGLKKLPVGERLTFSIRWLGLEAGRTEVTIKDIVKINGRDCYHIEAFSHTTYLLDLLFRIRDYHDSFMDVEEFYSHRFLKKASEGAHTYDETNDFDYAQNKAFYVNRKKNHTKVTELPGKVQDIVSVSYWFRTQDVEVGKGYKTFLHSDEKNYEVTIHVLKKDHFNIDGKTIPMMVIEPKARRGTKVFTRGHAKIWVTDDGERLPLFAELRVIIAGRLNIVLVSKENI
ncbi:MAG: DUF3108 domain-containing protein [Candidatus Omnitrophica bacterium]|nr:DUF3108 domain-containing protein [Candidatus Omnitrophota bacterium]